MRVDMTKATCPKCGATNSRLPPCSECKRELNVPTKWTGPHQDPFSDSIICGSCDFRITGRDAAARHLFKLGDES